MHARLGKIIRLVAYFKARSDDESKRPRLSSTEQVDNQDAMATDAVASEEVVIELYTVSYHIVFYSPCTDTLRT